MHELIEALLDVRVWPDTGRQIELIETHISYVLLVGDFAWKIKKPVRLGFVDFSTLEKRRQSCEDEVRLNRRLAEALYLDVMPIGGTPQAPRIGATPAIEYAVKMVRFSPSQTLDRLIEREDISAQAFHQLAERIAEFHRGLPPEHTLATQRAAQATFDALLAASDARQRTRLSAIGAWLSAHREKLESVLQARLAQGFVRECHGDLHLGNLVLLGDRITPFDCIEFSRDLRCIDTIDETAFVVMDLMAHGRADLGFEFLNRYLEVTGDYLGVRLLRYYLVYRALVRSYVRVLAAGPNKALESRPYLELTDRLIEAREPPLLLITNGLSGSGKTTVTQTLLGRLPAIRVRSDLVRKQLHGLPANADSKSGVGTGLYARSVSDETYQSLANFADAALDAGFNVIIDASFLERERRSLFAELAARHGARFVVLEICADEALLRERVTKRRARGRDASEAGLAVLERQLEVTEPILEDEPGIVIRVDTGMLVDADALVRTINESSLVTWL